MRLPRDNSAGSQHAAGMNNSTPTTEHDFSEFMWMAEEDLEAFDRKVQSQSEIPSPLSGVTVMVISL